MPSGERKSRGAYQLDPDRFRPSGVAGGHDKLCTACGIWKPATVFHFGKGTGALGIGGHCLPCQWAKKREKRAQDSADRDSVGPRYANRWEGVAWHEITPARALQVRAMAIRFATFEGYGWLAEEIASHAVIEAARVGGFVDLKHVLVDYLRMEFGHTGCRRNQLEYATIFQAESIYEEEFY